MMEDDLVRDREAEPGPFSRSFGREEGLCRPKSGFVSDASTVVDHEKEDRLGRASHRHVDRATLVAGVARVEQEVHERLLQKPRIAGHPGQVLVGFEAKRDTGLLEPMLDELDRDSAESGRVDSFERWRSTS